jgi:hypothetical protein
MSLHYAPRNQNLICLRSEDIVPNQTQHSIGNHEIIRGRIPTLRNSIVPCRRFRDMAECTHAFAALIHDVTFPRAKGQEHIRDSTVDCRMAILAR